MPPTLQNDSWQNLSTWEKLDIIILNAMTTSLLTREQLQERLIALHQASLELVKDISLETLLERIVSLACDLVEARYAALGVLDDEGKLERFITIGLSDKEIKRIPHLPTGRGLIGALVGATEPIRLRDVLSDPRSVGFPPGHPHMHSFLGVPIRVGERQHGQIYLTDKIGHDEFTPEDEQIIQMLAAYAGVAIQNARLYEELRRRDEDLTRRTEDLALLNNVASALASSLELDDILQKTLTLVMNRMDMEAGELFLLEADGQTLRMVLHRGQAADAFWTRNRFSIGEGIVGLAAQEREPIISTDLAKDLRFLREAVVKAGFRQMVAIPLLSGENLIGVLSIATRREDVLDRRTIQLLAAVGTWAGLAIENARLHDDARRLAVLEERERIGMDLHDGVIQSIFGVGLSLENVYHLIEENPSQARRYIQKAIEDLNQTIRDLRAYILDLRPRHLGNESLMEGLKRLVTEYRVHTLRKAFLTGPQDDLSDLPQDRALALFHICQEALANAAKHAEAQRVDISVWTTSERVILEITDDGRGFDIEKATRSIGHGLANMQTRARSVGGDVDITSTPGEGTTVLAWVPRTNGQKTAS
ncbi:MAG: GAF domain-containing protein [Anaerolineae bacterium]|nr:MAG: GAF domain-containing protein [Anaerolineae bacterium]